MPKKMNKGEKGGSWDQSDDNIIFHLFHGTLRFGFYVKDAFSGVRSNFHWMQLSYCVFFLRYPFAGKR